MKEVPRIVVTAMVEFNGRFLLLSRPSNKRYFPNMWAFPGGRVEFGETVIDALRREIKEETGLEIGNEGVFLNTYFDGDIVGVTFLIRAMNDKIRLNSESLDYKWIKSTKEMKELKCIPGIHNHLVDAKKALEKGIFQDLNDMNLIEEKYLNKN